MLFLMREITKVSSFIFFPIPHPPLFGFSWRAIIDVPLFRRLTPPEEAGPFQSIYGYTSQITMSFSPQPF